MKIPVIGIAGKARSGKDLTASLIMNHVPAYRYGLADPIKAMVDTIPGLDPAEQLEREGRKEEVIPEFGCSYRHLWQTLGTEWGRKQVHADIWLIVAGFTLKRKGPGMIISDVRFENEAHWIREQGGRMLHIVRPAVWDVTGSKTHASEAGVETKYSDLTLWNNGDIATLDQQVRESLRVMGELDGSEVPGAPEGLA